MESPPAPYLSAEEAADLLGLGLETVKRHLRAGRLPGKKVGRLWRVSRAALDAHLAAELADSGPEADQEEPTARAVLDLVESLRAAVARDAAPHLTPEARRELRAARRALEGLDAHLQSRARGARP